MKKAICMAVLAVTTFGSIYAAPVSDKTITAASDTTKKKVKMKGDKTKMKMKGDSTGKKKMKMKKDTMSTKM